MGNELAEWHPQAPLAPVAEPTRSWPPSLRKLSASMIGGWQDGAEIPEPISQTDQHWISKRLAHLDGLRQCDNDRQQVAKTLAVLFASYPAGQANDVTTALKVKNYLDALEDRPAWAVEEAAKRWIRGDVEARRDALDFPPSAARLRELATQAMEPLYVEKGRLALLRRAEVVPPISEAERQRRAEAIRRIIEGSKPGAAA